MLHFTTSLLASVIGFMTSSLSVSVLAQSKTENQSFKYPVYEGSMACDDKVTVVIAKNGKMPHQYVLSMGQSHYKTVRLPTDSGAIRLEDKANGIVWLQMSNKSMLLNGKKSQRLANNCHNAAQVAKEKELIATDAPTILDDLSRHDPAVTVTP